MPGLIPRDAVRRMTAYHPPTDGRQDKLRLDFNENTVGCSPAVVSAIGEYAGGSALTIYPEYGAARRELSAHFGSTEDEILLTNGTDEAIQVLVNTFVNAGDEVLVLTPSYAMYRFYAELAGATVRPVEYVQPDLDFPLEAILAAIRPRTKAIFLANPNNPTGTTVPVEVIRTVLNHAPEAAVLVDEAYFEFCGVTLLPYLSEHPNLFVCRTFSKAYGMAAMRMGCLFSQAGNVTHLRKVQSPYSVNMLAAAAARAAIRDTAYVSAYVRDVLAARSRILAGLVDLGLPVFQSQANFVLFKAGDRAAELCHELKTRGILVRNRSYELGGCVRVTCGTLEQAERFLDSMKKVKELW